MFKLLPKIILYRFANVKSGLISTHPLEASEKNVSKIIIIITNFPLAEKKIPVKAKLCWPTEAELMLQVISMS